MRLTVRDYQATPDGPPWFQLIEGQLVQEPSGTDPHQSAVGQLYLALALYLKEHPIGIIRVAPLDVYLDDANVFQPDILIVLNERASIRAHHGIQGAPDLVAEILSPSNRRYDTGPKKWVYALPGLSIPVSEIFAER